MSAAQGNSPQLQPCAALKFAGRWSYVAGAPSTAGAVSVNSGCVGEGVGVCVSDGVGVIVGVGEGVTVGVGDGVGVRVTVGEGVTVTVSVGEGVVVSVNTMTLFSLAGNVA